MAEGRVLNRELLAAAAAFLGQLEGVRQFPAVLDTTDIKVVLDLSRFDGLATPNAGMGVAYNIGQADMSAVSPEFVATIIGDGAGLQGAPGVSWRVDHLDLEITFDAAGRTAMVDKQMFLYVEIFDTGGDPGPFARPINLCNWWYGVLLGPLRYAWTLYGWSQAGVANLGTYGSHTWHGVVPAVAPNQFLSEFWGLRLVIGRVDGVALPANTKVRWEAMVRKSDNEIPPLAY